jgi:predicted ribosome quality control (RQC) complex YloA/Tae2 family protein
MMAWQSIYNVHNNYYFLKHLSKLLNDRLVGYTLVSCFSQNKDELIFEFNNSLNSFFVKASLQSTFSCLSFPSNFSRAKKNSIDLFSLALMRKVILVKQFQNERSFAVELENELSIVFKMHGNRANIIVFDGLAVKEIFRHHLTTDLQIRYNELDREINWSKEYFIVNRDSLEKTYFTFGKVLWNYLYQQNFKNERSEIQWQLINQLIQQLEQPTYSIEKDYHRTWLSLLPSSNSIKQFKNPIEAVTEFFYSYTTTHTFDVEKTRVINQLKAQEAGAKKYVQKNQQKLHELTTVNHYQAWGDLIMANMHTITQGMGSVVLENFYNNNEPLEIKLNREWNAQKNAEVFYRKSKNQQIEINKLKETIAAKEKEIEKVSTQLSAIEDEAELKGLRKKIGESEVVSMKAKAAPSLPYHEFEYKSFKILVGRNAEANDQLTFKHSFKDDLWLHAKDVAGSHVLIKHQSGKNFPKDVIERAAELAAYNSKRKTDSLCPVSYTPKKFIRKRKGDPAGAVVVEKENVIMVVPKL